MNSRIRENPQHVLLCFCEVVIPTDKETAPWIVQKYPDNFDDEEVLKSVCEFACPCDFTNDAVQHFSFVLTSLDSKWTYGYCRHAPNVPTLLCILSFLPWHETFYRLLNQIADLVNDPQSALLTFLENLYNCPVPDPGTDLHVVFNLRTFHAHCPNHLKLPSIPENRSLTEYFNAVDAHNMMIIFASMLHERRIIMTSRKLGRLSACVQAANMLIYPMEWQHIFIPVLPKHLLDYLSAPMPFLIGAPSSTLLRIELSELSEVVILDADNNRVRTPFKDFETLPVEIVSSLKRRLKNPHMMLGDGVSRAFMRALVHLIGGYRDALKMQMGEKITFDQDAFLRTRPSSIQPFLETMLHLQIFRQFIDDRLEMLNSGIGFSDDFELEVNMYEVNTSTRLKTQYKEWASTMKKEGGLFLKNVKSKTNPAVKSAYNSVKERSRRAYKDIRTKIQEIQRHSSQPDLSDQRNDGKPKSAPSSPSVSRHESFRFQSRISYIDGIRHGQGILDSGDLPSSMSVPGIRKYKMLTVDEISLASEDSFSEMEEMPPSQPLDMDLMGDLQDIIFRRCSTSSDGPHKEENTTTVNNIEVGSANNANPFGFEDSFSNDVFLPSPIPPPRTKRKQACPDSKSTASNVQDSVKNGHLIKLDSLDDSVFDPLKGASMQDDFPISIAPFKSPVDQSISELKNKIQKLELFPKVNNQSSTFYVDSVFLPRPLNSSVQSHSIYNTSPSQPFMPLEPNVNSYNLKNNTVANSQSLAASGPPLPPKTGIKLLTKKDQDLLNDYGLSNSPIFKGTTASNTTDPFADLCPMEITSKTNANNTGKFNFNFFDKNVTNVNSESDKTTSWQKFA